jgi:23S rRNA (pseudouridine1915-N3)-methyltransferase
MRLLLLPVGKIKRSPVREVLDDYLQRVRHYLPCDEIELKDGSEAEVAERIEKHLPERARVVALEVDGKAFDSKALAGYLERCERDAVGTLVFLIGGAYGLPPAVSRRAELRLSLSAMTFPHRLARVMLAEQLYRACTIRRGEPYSH